MIVFSKRKTENIAATVIFGHNVDNVCDYLCVCKRFNLKEIASDGSLTNRRKKTEERKSV